MREQLIERFIKYVSIHTTSDENSPSCPSTEIQRDFAKVLVEDLKALELEEVRVDENAYVTATLPATAEGYPKMGWIAHMDTAPNYNGKAVRAKIVENYDGKDLILDEAAQVITAVKDFPELSNYIGKTLITTDGTSLLGADDKAGIVEIIEAAKYLKEHPEIPHGVIRLAFTPDEEIGRGADLFPVKDFDCDFAYTVDGGELGEIEYENFNAASAEISIEGRDIHPGYAKDKMVNAILIGMELQHLLPAEQKPEYTTGYEGFFFLSEVEGTTEHMKMSYIIRDHSSEKFAEKKALLEAAIKYLEQKYPKASFQLSMKDSYYNMREKIEPVMHIVDLVKASMLELGIEPKVKAIRGGTDGSRLSYMGLPCPNIFTGGHNFHGKHEYIVVESMEKARDLLIKIAENVGKKQKGD